MDEIKLRQTENRINNLMNMRAAHYAVVIALSSGVVSIALNYKISYLVWMIIGFILDILFIMTIIGITNQIYKLILEVRK